MFKREGRQSAFRRDRGFLTAGALVICLFMQGLAVACFPVAPAVRSGADGALLSMAGSDCVRDSQDDRRAPVHKHAAAQCCLLCGERHHGKAAAAIVVAVIASTASWRPSNSFGAYAVEAPARPPAGWASSWSSQAPPFFS